MRTMALCEGWCHTVFLTARFILLSSNGNFEGVICVCFWRYVSGMTSAPAASNGLLLMKFWTIYPQIWPAIHVSGVAELLRITAAKVKIYWHYLRADGITRHLLRCALLIKIVKAFSRKYSFVFKRVFGNSFEILQFKTLHLGFQLSQLVECLVREMQLGEV